MSGYKSVSDQNAGYQVCQTTNLLVTKMLVTKYVRQPSMSDQNFSYQIFSDQNVSYQNWQVIK